MNNFLHTFALISERLPTHHLLGKKTPLLPPPRACPPTRLSFSQENWDPAVLHLDANLLRDFVILCMSAALGGVMAAGVGLPETLGYIVGGMVVGPSGVDVIRMVTGKERWRYWGGGGDTLDF